MHLRQRVVACILLLAVMPLVVTSVGECASPTQWLSWAENRGGCDNNRYMWKRDAWKCFWEDKHYRCDTCFPGKYHKRSYEGQTNPAAYPWQLGEDGRQVCLWCPKWTLRKGGLPSVVGEFQRYDEYNNFHEEDECLQDCPPIDSNTKMCTNTVVENSEGDNLYGLGYTDNICSKCPAGKTRFSAEFTFDNFGVFPGVSTGSRRPGSRRLLHAQVDLEEIHTYADFQFLGYDIDDVKIPNVLDFDYITTCKRCPSGMIQAADDWDGSLGVRPVACTRRRSRGT